ncbi:MAG: hypothetical protein EPO24_13505 [Bacteroidetes bacterium]|nr:MAG: hypothetical protein EPO24_13505 [Bacteroidota bacterium]
MELQQLMTSLQERPAGKEALNIIHKHYGDGIGVYPKSVRMYGNALFFIGRKQSEKNLYIVTLANDGAAVKGFEGEELHQTMFGPNFTIRKCCMTNTNANHLRELFEFTRPVVLGIADSFGFGDRLGIANPAHLRSLEGSHMKPVLAQQSVRELERTQRTVEEVLDAATWAVFQEGYSAGFGADADHLKTPEDIDRYARVGFTMYTFDPSAYVVNEAVSLPLADVVHGIQSIDMGDLRLDELKARYVHQTIALDGGVLQPNDEMVTRALLKYGGVIRHTRNLYKHLTGKHSSLQTEVEVSVDETDIPTTPFEHYFISHELKRLGVKLISLAPRFIGDFEKGVDYRGDLAAFEKEYRLHIAIAKINGPYKISIHSGSDKFSVYNVIGKLQLGAVHVKTAGTSYLEALRTAANVDRELVAQILDFSRAQYEEQKKSYHVSACLERVPAGANCSKEQLLSLFDEHDARQVFHVTFGKTLTERDGSGKFLFRDRLMACLKQHEELHYETLIRHFRKHLEPFEQR